jgi:hypothetical protein
LADLIHQGAAMDDLERDAFPRVKMFMDAIRPLEAARKAEAAVEAPAPGEAVDEQKPVLN